MTSLPAIPDGWTRCCLGELVEVIRGVSYQKAEAHDAPAPGLVPILRANNIGEKLNFENLVYVPESRVSENQLLRIGDIVVAASSGSRAVVGKAAPLQAQWHGAFGAFCMVVRPSERVNPRYVASFMATREYRTRVSLLAAGVNINNLRRQHVLETPIAVAPRPEQDRIVAELEKQFTRLDAGVAALERLQAHLRRYRAAVLKAASEGHLGSEVSSDEAVELDRPPASPPRSPRSWRWIPLGSVLSRIQSGKNFRCEERPPNRAEFGVVKVSAVTWGTFDSDESKTCMEEDRFDRALIIKPGDFLFSRANTIQLVGTCVIAGAVTRTLMLSDKILRFTIEGADPRWVMWMLRSPWGRAEIERLASGNQESMRNIGQDRIRQIRLPLPPISEQRRLVHLVEHHLSVADAGREAATATLARAGRLRASILSKAFSGALVPPEAPSGTMKVTA